MTSPKRRTRRALATLRACSLSLIALAAGCGSFSEYHSTAHHHTTSAHTRITTSIFVAWGAPGPSDDVRFDDPRLRRAVDETAAIVGQPVQFRFDLSLMPRPMGRFFDFLFERYVGRIPRDLQRLAARDADVFVFARERLRAIHFDYDGSVARPALAFDAATGVLRIQMNGSYELVSYGAVSYALDLAFRAHLQETFRGVAVTDVAPPDFRRYVRYLDGVSGDREVRAGALADALALYERARGAPPETRQAITAFLVRRFDLLGYERTRHPTEVASLPASSRWHEAERAFARFVQQSWAELDDRQRLTLLRAMLVRRGGPGRELDPFLRDTYPGVDLVALSLDVMDRWIAAGRPNPLRFERNDYTQELFNFVVCAPHVREHTTYDRNGCQGEVYLYATTEPSLRARFLDAILVRQSTELTEALFANLTGLSSRDTLLAWRHFEADATQWAAATRVLVDRGDYNRGYQRGELYDDAARIWRQRSAYRGSLLYALAGMDYPTPPRSRVVAWADFRRVFGSLASRADVDSYLAQGDGALVRISVVVPAIDRGVDIVAALTPHLERALGDERLRRRYRYFPYQSLRDLVEALRARGDRAGLAALRRYFEERITRHPSEQRWLETLAQMTSR